MRLSACKPIGLMGTSRHEHCDDSSGIMEIRRILCPLDFSETSWRALEHAIAIAAWYESRVIAMHVINPPPRFEPPILFAEPGQISSDADREYLEQRLGDWLRVASANALDAGVLMDEGDPAACILEQAESLPADLIVMGTRGRGGFERLLVGSVTETVLRKASCPVLAVPAPAASPSNLPYTRVLCPVDFSDSSLAALECALSVAEESDAHLTLLHVLDQPSGEDRRQAERFDEPAFQRAVEEDVRGRLAALVPDDARVWCRPDIEIRRGSPPNRILESAAAHAADVIVMGVRGRNALGMMMFGSTAYQVVRHASCPVLTLRR
jgi:nucleotide-binding universal stress UspA family protein